MAGPRMTPEQARATNPARSIWVGASAGTGKTHILTARVLRLMLEGVPPERILCLTFTKAAASEMQSRIFDTLSTWVLMADSALTDELDRRVGMRADADILARARRLFADVLELPAGLPIQNFHSYCTQLLGRFPIEAGTLPGARPIDEADAQLLVRTARDAVLATSQNPGEAALKSAVETVAARISDTSFDKLIHRLINERRTFQAVERRYGLNGLGPALLRRAGLPADSTAEAVRHAFCARLGQQRRGLARLAAVMAEGKPTEQGHAQSLMAVLQALDGGEEAWADVEDDYLAVFLIQDGSPRKSILTKATREVHPDLDDLCGALQSQAADFRQALLSLELVDATAALTHLAIRLVGAYEAAKRQAGSLDFQDLIDRVVALFSRSDMAPWVLYKLDAQIDHILVDEAQDTNADQWRVVEAMCAEFFAGESARSDIIRSVFAVGDDKQSIMGFQGADPREFLAARQRLFARAEAADYATDTVPLNRSFRSGRAVLELVDAVFADGAAARTGLSLDPAPIRHDYSRTDAGGSVTLWPMLVPDEGAKQTGWRLPSSNEDSTDTARRAARLLARHIANRLAGKDILPAKGRAIEPGDILILVRRRSRFYDQLSRALKEAGVPVAGRDQMRLLDELAVLDMLAVCTAALQPGDDLNLAAVLKSPLVALGEDDLFALAHARGKASLFSRLAASERPTHQAAAARLNALIAGAEHRSPVSFLAHLLGPLGCRASLRRALGSEVDEPLDALLEAAQAYEDSHSDGLQGFLRYMQGGGATIKRDADAASDAVRIMTAHGAKGLQAPIVYVTETVAMASAADDVQLIRSVDASDPTLWWTSGLKGVMDTEKDRLKADLLAEYRRLLYVALTRAEDEVHILGWRGPRAAPKDCWYRAVEDAFDRLDGVDTATIDGLEVRRRQIAHTGDVHSAPRVAHVRTELEDAPWLYEPAPVEARPVRPLAPLREASPPASTSPLVRGALSPADRGSTIHQLLEWAAFLPPQQRRDRMAAWLAQPGLQIAAPVQADILAAVCRVLEHADYAPLFDAHSRAEVALSGLVDGRVVSARVDRLRVTDDRVWVVDFKTHRQVPESADDMPSDIVDQMATYAHLINKIYPEKDQKIGVLFTELPKIIWLNKENLLSRYT